LAMTNSEKRVLKKIRDLRKVLSTDLPKLTKLAPRIVSLALERLCDKGLVKKLPNLGDMRTVWYYPVEESTGTKGCNTSEVLK
jgi:DNA-binding MarR family transcriptional regulator